MNTEDFDTLIESICAAGCLAVTKTIIQLERRETPSRLKNLSHSEQLLVLKELKSIMDIYGGNVCSL